MFIESLTIQGFKSYKNQVLLDLFSSSCNVVVGRNGSGKSNFFSAIRFVLGDAYQNMTREERQSLLHEGQGPPVISAYVEILFNNEDNRFPTGKDKVTLRRTIGLKKDEYSLDKKTVTKSEVLNLLESAGFSRSNPYYIVPQGRITALTNAKDQERLHLLKEVAGTKVYEQKRLESNKIMGETTAKRDQIDELLNFIETRLEELEEEKKELQEYQAADRERRCLEYAIYSADQQDALDHLEDLERERDDRQTETVDLYKKIADRQMVIDAVEKELLQKRDALKLLMVEKDQAQDDIDNLMQQKTHHSLKVNDLSNEADADEQKRQRLLNERDAINAQISDKQRDVRKLTPAFEKIVAQEIAQKENLSKLQSELEQLTAKQGRHEKFNNAKERDAWITSTVSDLQNAVDESSKQLQEMTENHDKTGDQVMELEGEIDTLKQKITGRRALLDKIEQDFLACRTEKDALEGERKNLWRDEARINATLDTLKQQVDTHQRSLLSTVDRNTSKGLASVENIVNRLNIEGYYGPLYGLFEVDQAFQTAVDVIGGSSLFHLVVDTDQTASRILEVLNKERGGRVTFMPLNRLKPKQPTYPSNEDALPLISRLEYDQKFHPAILQVFGKAILAASLEEASVFARSHQLTGITLEGDRADRKGALSGGFNDFNKSRLEVISQLKQSKESLVAELNKIDTIKLRLLTLDREILRLRDKTTEIDTKKRTVVASRDPIVKEISLKTQKLDQLREFQASEEKSIQSLQSQIDEMKAKIVSAQREIGVPFQKRLNANETARLAQLPELVQESRTELSDLLNQRIEIESKKNELEIALESNLRRSLEDVQEKLERLDEGSTNNTSINAQRQELVHIQEQFAAAQARLNETEERLDECQEAIQDLEKRIETQINHQQADRSEVEDMQRAMDKFLTKKAVLIQKKETALRHIRELGVLPDEAFEKYQDTDSKLLLPKLHKVNENLKKYSHVNKKAFEQYGNFTKQREQLQDRKAELDASAKSIETLITTLDQRKNEAIDRTFSQVAEHFKDVWHRLVPSGDGELVMMSASEDESQTQTENGNTERYVGVSLNVSFQPGQNLRMAQLSGGQKSLVALALIFAIQKCDPAPFYLFDEIDAALDAQYRSAVADMVHELSQNAQFIITTFRPELLDHADKFYGVTFASKVSAIQSITVDQARQFVESQIATTA